MTSSFDDFVESLPNSEEGFDINSELNPTLSDSQPETNGNTVNKIDSENEDLPFNKNPKIKKYIERQVQKGLKSVMGNTQQEFTRNSLPAQNPSVSSVPSEWVAMYGDDERSLKAWEYNQSILSREIEKAKEDLLKSIEQKEYSQKQRESEVNNFIEESIESIEEDNNISLSKKDRSEFLDLVQRLSPKNEDGDIVSFADFGTSFEIFKQIKSKGAPSNSVNKALASRSASSNTSSEIKTEPKGYVSGMGANGIRSALGL